MLITYLSQISVIEPNFFVLKAFSQIMENEILYLVAVYMMLDPLSLLSKMKNFTDQKSFFLTEDFFQTKNVFQTKNHF